MFFYLNHRIGNSLKEHVVDVPQLPRTLVIWLARRDVLQGRELVGERAGGEVAGEEREVCQGDPRCATSCGCRDATRRLWSARALL